MPPGLRQLVQTGPGLNTRLLFGGAVLMGVGGAIALAGFTLGTSAVIAADPAMGAADGDAPGRAREAALGPGQDGDRRRSRRLAERAADAADAVVQSH